jgi:hypothetical protein
MCSIEEAWAGQTFDNYPVQSQADLRRKYMPIADNLLTRNDEFSVGNKEPAPRVGNNGINTKMIRPLNIPNSSQLASNGSSINFSQAPMDGNNYGGLDPRPGYMSIYDNAGQGLPMPADTQSQGNRSPFGDINQAFQVSHAVERFMNRGNSNNNNNNNQNPLLNEDNDEDVAVLTKKFNSTNSVSKETKDSDKDLVQMQSTLQDILHRLEKLENQMHSSMGSSSRNMYDMVLYVLIGMLIAFILYSLLRR